MQMKNFLLEKGWLPDFLVRRYVRGQCQKRLNDEHKAEQDFLLFLKDFALSISLYPIALETAEANIQHYEVSTDFFRHVLGKRMKYSSCYWPLEKNDSTIDSAEDAMLSISCERAEIHNGMDILELGCGWGSMTLYLAAHYPASKITAVSNSATQKAYIDQQAKKLGFTNVEVVTADMNDFQIAKKFDRVISIEMFEHMRNWGKLLSHISEWLKIDGKLFIHIFTFDGRPYLYDAQDPDDWMARNFFASGMMPCPSLIHQFNRLFNVTHQWKIVGTHYQKTLNAWLENMDASKADLYPLFEKEYNGDALKFWNHWRVFFMACAEVFGFEKGEKWFVSHYLLEKV
jgi:cyclopropane-fatty-acyl-phospholipid synthase